MELSLYFSYIVKIYFGQKKEKKKKGVTIIHPMMCKFDFLKNGDITKLSYKYDYIIKVPN